MRAFRREARRKHPTSDRGVSPGGRPCLAAPAVAGAAPQLRVAGNHLVDGRSGQTFVPRGVNWPSFEYACSDGYGYSNSASAQNVGPDAAGAALIASWHINTVRLPLNQDCWLGEDGLPKFGKTSGYRAAVRRWVVGAAQGGPRRGAGPALVGARRVWSSDGQRAMPDDRSDDFWSSVARTFKKDRSVIFDVFNEPYSRYDTNGTLIFDLTWNCWRNGGCAAPRTGDRQALDGGTFTDDRAGGRWSTRSERPAPSSRSCSAESTTRATCAPGSRTGRTTSRWWRASTTTAATLATTRPAGTR